MHSTDLARWVESTGLPIPEALDIALEGLKPYELASLGLWDWPFWCLPHQDLSGDWRTFGYMTGRGTGKTRSIVQFLIQGMREGNIRNFGLMSQDENRAVDTFILGEDGLVSLAPPDFPCEWEPGALIIHGPNGSRGRVFTPLSPNAMRGSNFDTFVADEIAFWPLGLRDVCWAAIEPAVRKGWEKLVWATTPQDRDPTIRKFFKRHEQDPEKHRVMRGGTMLNMFLSQAYIDDQIATKGDTRVGRREIYGEFFDGAEGALFQPSWINDNRRPQPGRLERVVIGLDPSTGDSARADRSGVVIAGLGTDRQVYVLADLSARYPDASWLKVVFDEYFARKADCVVVELNAGGSMVRSALVSYGQTRGVQVIPLKAGSPARHEPNTLYTREVRASVGKQVRAEPVAVAYELGRVSHVQGCDFTQLEDTMLLYDPSALQGRSRGKSPDDLDALVYAVTELLGLEKEQRDPRTATTGLAEINRTAPKQSGRLGPLILSGGWNPHSGMP